MKRIIICLLGISLLTSCAREIHAYQTERTCIKKIDGVSYKITYRQSLSIDSLK